MSQQDKHRAPVFSSLSALFSSSERWVYISVKVSLELVCFKAQGHVTINKPVISMIYIITHTWPLCSAQILVDGVNPQ